MLFISGCQSSQPRTEIFAHTPEIKKQSQLTAELLYDFLVASIASQRNQPLVALKSLSNIAYQTKDRRILSEAIQFAINLEEYQQAIELGQFFKRLEPDNYRITLALANAQFKLGKTQRALAQLIDLVKNQTVVTLTGILVLHDIVALLSAQDQKTILPEFRKHLEKNPTNEQLTLTATLLATRLGHADEFIRFLDKTLELKPNWEFPSMLKLSDLSKRAPDSMTSFAEHYLQANPQHEQFKLLYAQILINQNNIDSALSQLKEILAFNPDSANALYAIGTLYLHKNLLAESKIALLRYLDLTLKNDLNRETIDQSRIFLSDIEFELKNYASALLHLHGVSSQKHYFDAQIKRARITAQRDDNADFAISQLQQIYTVDDDQRLQIVLEQSQLLKDDEQLQESRLVLDEGLEEFPDQPDLLHNRGMLAAQMELLELHEQDMRKLIALQPNNAHFYNTLGYTLADQTDRLDEAMNLITKANALLPGNGYILDSMGWVHFRLGHNGQAIKFLRHALAVMQDAEIAAHLGEVLWVVGDREGARKIWRQGIEWSPENLILQNTIDRFSPQKSSALSPDTVQTIK